MKNNKIAFREIRSSDYEPLEKIINETWKYEQFCSKKIAKTMSKLYLALCLTNQNFTCVATNDGEPVGIIIGKVERKQLPKIKYMLRSLLCSISINASSEGRAVAKMFSRFEVLDRELLKESGQKFDGELAFFAIKEDQRGLGIGKSLFQRAMLFMKSKNIQNFYLYTDVSCNYGFYEHLGMKRLNERNFSFRPYSDKEMLFFLYSYNF